MKIKTILLALTIATTSLYVNAQSKKPANAGPKKPMPKPSTTMPAQKTQVAGKIVTENDSLSYAIGVNIGQSFKQQGLENLDLNLVKMAINDMLKGNTPLISPEQCMPVIMNTMKKAQEKKFAPLKAEGEKYLAENAKKPGVTVTTSGLQYEVITKGTGELPKATDQVKVHYHGTTINGNVFDSSVDRGQPATFGVTQVIQGWVEALQLMPVGSKWKLTIPQNLAYGERGAGENIPPFSTLIFDVEVLEIVKAN